jgi:hypothetical protein
MKGCEFGVLLSVTSLNAMLSSFEELRINSGEQSGFSNVDAARSSESRSFRRPVPQDDAQGDTKAR